VREEVSSRPPPRSSSADPPRSPAPGDQGNGDGFKDADGGEVVIEIADGVTRVTGDVTYQVQMYIPREGAVHRQRDGQKQPTVCIRGPSRVDKPTVEDDAHRLKKAYLTGGIAEVRKVRAALTGRGGYDLR